MTLKLRAKSLKVTTIVDAAALAGFVVPNGAARVALTLEAGGAVFKLELNAKSLRRAVAVVTDAGMNEVSVLLQGKLVGDSIIDAGITATPRQSAPARETADA